MNSAEHKNSRGREELLLLQLSLIPMEGKDLEGGQHCYPDPVGEGVAVAYLVTENLLKCHQPGLAGNHLLGP